MKNRLVNCTGREVRLARRHGPALVLPAAPCPAELVPVHRADLEAPQGVPLVRARAARVAGLPPPVEGVLYLVEPIIALAFARKRWDLVCVEDGAGLVCWDASPEVSLAGGVS